ncbi:hypothetical protein [Nocardioides sp.]|uniref:hypothetical protein n=1 Tax=Nocardioides sp. TaxID=35761 RepID=UPI003569E154
MAILLALVLAGSACSGDAEKSATPSTSPSAESGPPPVTTRITLGKTTGKLSTAEKRKLKRAVGTKVDGWLDAAYLEGDYPRKDFADAFPGFTRGARADARRDKDLMSNHDIGRRVDVVQATRRRVRVDALVVDGRAVGSTARVILEFRTDGEVAKKFEVRGRLFLSRPDGWRIFGYDITKGAAR